MLGGTFESVYGGMVSNANNIQSASNNTVILNGATRIRNNAGTIYGGSLSISSATDGTVSNNKVVVKSGSAYNIYGGYSEQTKKNLVTNNIVEISGGDINMGIYGGSGYNAKKIP